jgi:mannitol/fructose-specific phosphotransferase system IIA component (Ntr-type)
MAVVLADVLNPEHVILELRARSRDEAIREIVAAMAGPALADPEKLVAAVLEREAANTTYVGKGVALPHARTELVSQILLGIGRSTEGVPFGSGGEVAHLIFVIGVPQRMVTDYLVCIGALARLTRDENTRAELMNAATASELVELLREGSLLLE